MILLLHYLIEKYPKGNIRLILVIEVCRTGIHLLINLAVGMFLSFTSVHPPPFLHQFSHLNNDSLMQLLWKNRDKIYVFFLCHLLIIG